MVTDDLDSSPQQRERIGIVQSLAAGTVPPAGLRRLQVGRTEELEAVIEDLSLAEAGVSTVRFIAGAPESGKTFFLNLVRTVAVERGFLVVRADFSTARRLHSTSGEARAFYRALMTNISITGIGLRMESLVAQTFALPDQITLSFQLPNNDNPLKLVGKVIHRRTPGEAVVYGIEFDKNKTEDFRRQETAIAGFVLDQQKEMRLKTIDSE